MNAPKGASGYSRKDLSTTLEMTGRGNARDDREGEFYRAADCFDSIGDTDSTGCHIVHGGISPLKKRAGSVKTSGFLF